MLSNWQDSITHRPHYRNYYPDMLGLGDSTILKTRRRVFAMGGPATFHRVATQVWTHLSNETVPPETIALVDLTPEEVAANKARVRAALLAKV